MRTFWVPKCKWCGEVYMNGIGDKEGDIPPVTKPDMSFARVSITCRESPTGRHNFEWVRYK